MYVCMDKCSVLLKWFSGQSRSFKHVARPKSIAASALSRFDSAKSLMLFCLQGGNMEVWLSSIVKSSFIAF